MGPGGHGGPGSNGPLDIHGNSIINESMWDAVFPLLDAHFLQVHIRLNYSGDLNTDHFNTEFLKFRFKMAFK